MATDTKTFRRIPERGRIFGVCAGIADYFDMDVTLVRVIFAVLTILSGGAFLLVYLVLALIMPVTGRTMAAEVATDDYDDRRRSGNARNYVGIALIVFGAWLLLGQFFPFLFWALRWEFIWPVILIVLGLLIVTKRR